LGTQMCIWEFGDPDDTRCQVQGPTVHFPSNIKSARNERDGEEETPRATRDGLLGFPCRSGKWKPNLHGWLGPMGCQSTGLKAHVAVRHA